MNQKKDTYFYFFYFLDNFVKTALMDTKDFAYKLCILA